MKNIYNVQEKLNAFSFMQSEIVCQALHSVELCQNSRYEEKEGDSWEVLEREVLCEKNKIS